MQTFALAPPNPIGQRSTSKNLFHHKRFDSVARSLPISCLDYVFVDEHNRHKRLKGIFLSYGTFSLTFTKQSISDEGM